MHKKEWENNRKNQITKAWRKGNRRSPVSTCTERTWNVRGLCSRSFLPKCKDNMRSHTWSEARSNQHGGNYSEGNILETTLETRYKLSSVEAIHHFRQTISSKNNVCRDGVLLWILLVGFQYYVVRKGWAGQLQNKGKGMKLCFLMSFSWQHVSLCHWSKWMSTLHMILPKVYDIR